MQRNFILKNVGHFLPPRILYLVAAGGGAAAKQPFAASITASSTATTACEGGRLATPWLVDPSANKPVPPPVFGAGFLQVFPGLIFGDGSAWFWIFLNLFGFLASSWIFSHCQLSIR